MSDLFRRQVEFAQDVADLLKWIGNQGIKCTFGEAFRSEEQAAIYAKEGKGIADSLHCERLAVDLNFFSALGTYMMETELYKPAGIYWESLNKANRWGGRFTRADGNHFERQNEG